MVAAAQFLLVFVPAIYAFGFESLAGEWTIFNSTRLHVSFLGGMLPPDIHCVFLCVVLYWSKLGRASAGSC